MPDRVVAPGELGQDDFEIRPPEGLLTSRPVKRTEVKPRVWALARLCPEVYRQVKQADREYKLQSADAQEREMWKEYGLHFLVVCPVFVTPIGSEGTWMVNLVTTGVVGPDHPGMLRTTFIFNESRGDLSKPSRSLRFDWVVAEREGKYVIVGNREKLGGVSEKELQTRLSNQGYANIEVISIAEEDRRVGFKVD